MLKSFVTYFNNAGFSVLFGTEHNTPDMFPLTVTARGKKPLDDELKRISEQGCCLVAAHQYLVSKGYHSFVDNIVQPEIPERKDYIALGRAVIEKFIIS